ncbi:MAG: right-handed parallel beta-helix repeat-containing protein [Verrucomicrobiota bacterium]
MQISVDDHWQSIIDANPAATTYRIQSGEHRLQSCIPKDGDTFIGDFGAYMKGSKLLDSSTATEEDEVWVFTDQTQALLVFEDGVPRATQVGNDLFLDGIRLLHEDSRSSVDESGEFYFDHVADEIVMFDNPIGRKVEATVSQTAMNLNGLYGVTLRNFTIMHYGSLFRPEGAVQSRRSTNTTVQYMEFRDNHSVGLALGPNMLIEHCRFYNQGQMGASGGGQIDDGPLSPITIRNSEFCDNNSIREDWQTNGAEGSVKVTLTKNSIFENCWVHDNWTFGVWYDIRNEGAVIRSNLIENTTSDRRQNRGIYFEISGNADDPSALTSDIYWNTIRASGETSIDISSSSNVRVYENQILDGVIGLTVRDSLRGQRNSQGFLENVSVYNNEIETGSYFARVSDESGSNFAFINLWDSNRYYGANPASTINTVESTINDWQSQLGFDLSGSWQNVGSPVLPAAAVSFQVSHYGPKIWEHNFELVTSQLESGRMLTLRYDSLKEMGILQRSYTYRTDLISGSWLPITPQSETVVEESGNCERIEATFLSDSAQLFLNLNYTGL